MFSSVLKTALVAALAALCARWLLSPGLDGSSPTPTANTLYAPACASADHLRHYEAFSVCFDGSGDDDDGDGWPDTQGVPAWVSGRVAAVPPGFSYPAYARPSPWRTDEYLHASGEAPDDTSYRNSGYTRGHMFRKKDADRAGEQAGLQSHTVLNACPQLREFNAGVWAQLENKVSEWADKYGELWVISGPIFYGATQKRATIGDLGELHPWSGLLAAMPRGVLVERVLRRLSHADLASFAMTCRAARDAARDASLWRHVTIDDVDDLALFVRKCPQAVHVTRLEIGDDVFSENYVSAEDLETIADATPIAEALAFAEGTAFTREALGQLLSLRRLRELSIPEISIVREDDGAGAEGEGEGGEGSDGEQGDAFAPLEALCERRGRQVRALRVYGGGSEVSYGAASACVQGLTNCVGALPEGDRCLPELTDLVAGDIDNFEVLLFAGSQAQPVLPALRTLAINMDGEPDEDPSEGFGEALHRSCPALREIRAGGSTVAEALLHCDSVTSVCVDAHAGFDLGAVLRRDGDLAAIESVVAVCHASHVHASTDPSFGHFVNRCPALRKLFIGLGERLQRFEFAGDCGALLGILQSSIEYLVVVPEGEDEEAEQLSDLRAVDLCISADADRQLGEVLEALQAISSATLESLSIMYTLEAGLVPSSFITTILDAFPKLRELSLRNVGQFSDLLDDADVTPRLEAMKRLSMHCVADEDDAQRISDALADSSLAVEEDEYEYIVHISNGN
eukprot:m51a1_g6995 putative nuclease (742) ;mRNA; r:176654-180071